jgi:hypothetical protein
MYDGIFFINHAINGLARQTVYSQEERYKQTLETINSINEYCPNNKIFIFDSSPIFPKTEYILDLIEKGIDFTYNGDDPLVNFNSSIGNRSIAECLSFRIFLKRFKENKNKYQAKRIYKLSGRYRLNKNFVLDDEKYKDSFVFLKPIVSPLLKDRDYKRIRMMISPFIKNKSENEVNQKIKNFCQNFKKYYNLRLWHMDYNLLDTFEKEIENILKDCIKYTNSHHSNMDVEHAYYKNLHTYKTIELDKIGVCGNIALNGKYIDE